MEKSPDAFRTISEVAELLETPAHVLRFWESRFPQIKPVKRAGGRRYYRPSDVALIAGIRRLLHNDGLTIRGVQKMLREEGVRHVAALSNMEYKDPPEGDDDALPEDIAAVPAEVTPAPVVSLAEWRQPASGPADAAAAPEPGAEPGAGATDAAEMAVGPAPEHASAEPAPEAPATGLAEAGDLALAAGSVIDAAPDEQAAAPDAAPGDDLAEDDAGDSGTDQPETVAPALAASAPAEPAPEADTAAAPPEPDSGPEDTAPAAVAAPAPTKLPPAPPQALQGSLFDLPDITAPRIIEPAPVSAPAASPLPVQTESPDRDPLALAGWLPQRLRPVLAAGNPDDLARLAAAAQRLQGLRDSLARAGQTARR